jgi:hypothetical protein
VGICEDADETPFSVEGLRKLLEELRNYLLFPRISSGISMLA